MAQKVSRILQIVLACGCLLGTLACGNGTEVGNPSGTRRNVTGSLTVDSAQLTLVTPMGISLAASCPLENGDVTVVLRDITGDTSSVEVESDGSFSAEIDRDLNYEILFQQGDIDCGHLVHAASSALGGLRVTLGQGDLTVELGALNDLGNGIIETTSNPAQFCDNDDDGITDDLDNDDDNDGIIDTDNDFDGYIDWFDGDDDNDGVSDTMADEDTDEETDNSDNSCEVLFVYPSSASGFELDEDSLGQIEVTLTSTIDSVLIGDLAILNASGQDVVSYFAESDASLSETHETLLLSAALPPETHFILTIPSNVIRCENGQSNSKAVEIEFFTLDDDQ